ncbi:predicted protein [Uncinocarpus reesii 1704]|uniref:Zn(2)-C6 fungal-type domain-containing protein n=1 Tax=Uncinocarpus reesii (strain UAMH 1704) TaxID=336963 RepID=C4JHB0_UNCRE|nr:uncharacterized protein UREG_02683 [Uncinocarpus reesii 1704]EEP77834.1 predicted protein [Uncinocarpus reesii 1704]
MAASEASRFGQESGYSTPVPNAWNIPSNAFPARSNIQLGPSYPNTLALWHNPHRLHTSESHDFRMQSQIPQRPPEQKRHKRTKSGCFTCRARRVKCDETRPICERCSKGKRECTYPPSPMLRKDSRSNMKMNEKYPPIRESESEENSQNSERKLDLQPRHMKDASRHNAQSVARRKMRQSPETKCASPSSDMTDLSTKSPSPVASADPDSHSLPSPTLSDQGLTSDVMFFVAYRKQNINYHHYILKSHASKFINEDMMSYALGYEPLLYAVVAFSAYHYSIAHPNGKIYTFLQYYNKSVSLLLNSLRGGENHHDAMLLTILQLAAFEEFVGDWVNLIDHHQAAHRMLVELYSPESINVDYFHRHILLWYNRYDVMAGLMSGNSMVLSREWYIADEEFSMQDSFDHPHDLNKKVMAWGARTRRFAMDMASLFAKMSHGLITLEQFKAEKEIVDNTWSELHQFVETMKDPRYLVLSYPHQQPLEPDAVFDPYAPGVIYGDELWEVNFCFMELITATLLYKYQTAPILQNLDLSELKTMAMEQAQRIETLSRWPNRPEEMHLWFMSPLGMAVLFLPHDEKYNMWCRKKMARNEQLGYIYPPMVRTKLADLWKTPELEHWWLPNDEGYPKIVREIRAWTKERVNDPRDTFREAVRDIKAVFGNMSLEDSSSPASTPSVHSSAYLELSPGRSPKEQTAQPR